MAAIVSTRITALQAISPRTTTSPVIEPLRVAPIDGAGMQMGQTDFDTGAGIFIGYSSGVPKLSLGDSAGDKLTWTAAAGLVVVGTITASAGSIGGWTINADYLAKDTGTDATSAGMSPTDYPFYAGATYANRASAPFHVTPDGSVIAADFATATSGKRIDIGATTAGELRFYADLNGSGSVLAGTIGISSSPGSSVAYFGNQVDPNAKHGAIGTSYSGSGLIGSSVSGAGVWGETTSNVGVYGVCNTGTGGYFVTSGAGRALQAMGGSSYSAAYISGGTGQYALELAGTGTALIPGSVTTPAINTASGALTITPAAGSGVSLVLSTTGDFVVNTNQLVVDTSAGRVGIGTATPEQPLHAYLNANSGHIALISNATSGAAATAVWRARNDAGKLVQTGMYSSTTTAYGAIAAGSAHLYTDSAVGLVLMGDNATCPIIFASGGSTERMRISAAGEITAPYQPAFLAYNSATDADQTGNGAGAKVDFDTEVFDQGSDFTADTFTAPVTGRYRLSTNVRLDQLTNATDIAISLVTSNRTFHLSRWNGGTIGGGGMLALGGSALTDMDAGDTAYIDAYATGIGANTADIYGHATIAATSFSGELVC